MLNSQLFLYFRENELALWKTKPTASTDYESDKTTTAITSSPNLPILQFTALRSKTSQVLLALCPFLTSYSVKNVNSKLGSGFKSRPLVPTGPPCRQFSPYVRYETCWGFEPSVHGDQEILCAGH